MRTNRISLALALCTAALAARPARAQAGGSTPAALSRTRSVSGSAFDAATGMPVLRGRVCVLSDAGNVRSVDRCVPLEAGGNFRIQRLPASAVTIHVACEPLRRFNPAPGVPVSLDLSERDTSGLAVPIPTADCDMRPVVSITGEFEGIYTVGFESSSFRYCDGTSGAWVTFETKRVRWPRQNDEYYPTYYVRWIATRTGPGRYGHMDGAVYSMVVHRVLELRPAHPDDCH